MMDATQMIFGPLNKDNNLKDYIMMSDDEEPGISLHYKSIESEIEENPLGAQGLNPIDKLNDDCLRLIFQYLPIFDKVRVEAGRIFNYSLKFETQIFSKLQFFKKRCKFSLINML